MPASPGIVDGPVHLLRWEVPDVRHRIIPDEAIPAEVKRFHAALDQAKAKLYQVRARAEKHAGPEEAAIFDVQLSILEDGELLRQVEELIRQNLAAEFGSTIILRATGEDAEAALDALAACIAGKFGES
jgi:phosphoenolpyruvate-protein kinase (PTS system EI component)